MTQNNENTLYLRIAFLGYAWAFAGGSLIYYSLSFELSWLDISLPLGIVGILLFSTKNIKAGLIVNSILILILTFILGIFVAKTHTSWQKDLATISHGNEKQEFIAVVDDISYSLDGKLNLIIQKYIKDKKELSRCTLLLKLKKNSNIKVGNTYKFIAMVYAFYSPAYPNAWDSARQYWLQQICGQGYVIKYEEIKDDVNLQLSLFKKIKYFLIGQTNNFRKIISSRIDKHLSSNEANVAKAMTVGIKIFPEYQLASWQKSGLGHLLAISGLHMGIVLLVTFFIIRYAFLLIPQLKHTANIKYYAVMGSVISASVYVLLAGASISAQRAFIMGLLAMMAILYNRTSDTMRILALTIYAVILIKPSLVSYVGFQLSFVSVTAILVFLNTEFHKVSITSAVMPELPFYRFVDILYVLIKTSLIVSIATFPIIIYHFGTITGLGVITNIIAIPIATFIVVPSLFLAVLLIPLGLENIGFVITEIGISLTQLIVDYSNQIDWLYTIVRKPNGFYIVIIMISFFILAFRKKIITLVSIVILIITIYLIINEPNPSVVVSATSPVAMIENKSTVSSNTFRLSRYEQQQWLKYLGINYSQRTLWKDFENNKNQSLQCDKNICDYMIDKSSISFVFQWNKRMICPSSDVTVFFNQLMAPNQCKSENINISAQDLSKTGTLFLYKNNDSWKISTTHNIREARPWYVNDYRWRRLLE